MIQNKKIVMLILLCALTRLVHAQDSTKSVDQIKFVVIDGHEQNHVTFKSTAPLEDIVGTSSSISGFLVFDPANPEAGSRGEITVPVSSFNTGIPLRDEHLVSSDWFNADKFPNITFTVISVTEIVETKNTQSASSWDVTAPVRLSMHGFTKEISVPARITYLKGDAATGEVLAARTSFEFALDDFKITGPSGKGLIGTKVGEIIQVEASVIATARSEATSDLP